MSASVEELRTDGLFPKFAWPGGYPMYYVTEQGLTVCPKCANEPDTSDPVVEADTNWEDPDLHCDDCNVRIESAYAERDWNV